MQISMWVYVFLPCMCTSSQSIDDINPKDPQLRA